MKKEINTLICSGGGVKGLSYIGVLKALNEIKENNKDIKIDIKTIYGVSIGTLCGLLYMIDYDINELEKEILEIDLIDFINVNFENLINKYGMDSGKKIKTWIENMLLKKNIKKNITFEELYKLNKIHYKVLVTNLNTFKLTTFDYINTPKLKVVKAIKMAISLPLIFTAEKYKDQIYIDGALIDNYPIHLYDNQLDNVLGIKLLSHGTDEITIQNEINGLDNFLLNTISCFMLQRDKYNLMKNNYKDHTIFVYSDGNRETLNFGIEKDKKIKLINSGYNYTKEFFKNNSEHNSENNSENNYENNSNDEFT
jgi:predicted acylesterase/phospholipase RssA